MAEDTAELSRDDEATERPALEATSRALRSSGLTGAVASPTLNSAVLLAAGARVSVVVVWSAVTFAACVVMAVSAGRMLRMQSWPDLVLARRRMELLLVVHAILNGSLPWLAPLPDHGGSQLWFATLLVVAMIIASNVLLGYGRSRTFFVFAVPMTLLTAGRCLMLGGAVGVLLAIGCVVVGVIFGVTNAQAGAVFRTAVQLRLRNEQLVAELDRRAHLDDLTGVANRAGLGRDLDRRSRRVGAVGVVFLDLDGFKAINDEHGHAAGDAVLRTIATRMTAAVRDGDSVARLGGDEFLVVVDIAHPADLEHLTERIRVVVATPIVFECTELHVVASIGSAIAADAAGLENAIRAADSAMYAAKRLPRAASSG